MNKFDQINDFGIDPHYPFSALNLNLVSRHPIKVHYWGRIVAVFQPMVWVALLLTLFSVMITIFVVNKSYNSLALGKHLVRGEEATLTSIALNLLGSLTEPNVYPWFTSNSKAGRIVIGFWALSVLFIGLSYNSLVRAHLIKPATENAINDKEDVFQRGEKFYLLGAYADESMIEYFTPEGFWLVDMDLVNYAFERKTLGVLPPPLAFIPDYVINDILDNGASTTTTEVRKNQ